MNEQGRHLGFAVFSFALCALVGSTIWELIHFSLTETSEATQIIAVPFVSGALLFLKRRDVFRQMQSAPWLGVLVIGFGTVMMIGAARLSPQLAESDALALSAVSALVTWFGGVFLFYGIGTFRRALFPLMFLGFCVPIPHGVLEAAIDFLRRASADMAHVILILTGTPVYRHEFTFVMPGLEIEVAPECSGIRSSIGMLMTSLIAGYVMLRSWWRRAALVAIAIPLMILKNAIRIDTLSLLSIHIDPSIIEGRLHHEGGIVFFGLGLLLLYPVLVWLMKAEISQTDAPAMHGVPG